MFAMYRLLHHLSRMEQLIGCNSWTGRQGTTEAATTIRVRYNLRTWLGGGASRKLSRLFIFGGGAKEGSVDMLGSCCRNIFAVIMPWYLQEIRYVFAISVKNNKRT